MGGHESFLFGVEDRIKRKCERTSRWLSANLRRIEDCTSTSQAPNQERERKMEDDGNGEGTRKIKSQLGPMNAGVVRIP